jgi:hypothetical protein
MAKRVSVNSLVAIDRCADCAYLQFRSKFKWVVSNLVALLRWNMFTYRALWEWIDRPFETPPESADQLSLNLDSRVTNLTFKKGRWCQLHTLTFGGFVRTGGAILRTFCFIVHRGFLHRAYVTLDRQIHRRFALHSRPLCQF